MRGTTPIRSYTRTRAAAKIVTSYTDDGLKYDLVGTRREVTYQGRVTGRTPTTVTKFYPHSSTNNGQYIEVSENAQPGDSGGIVFHDIYDGDGVKVVGTIQDYGRQGAEVQTAEAIEDGFNGFFV